MRSVIFNQCRDRKMGVMLLDLGALTTARAREFWICRPSLNDKACIIFIFRHRLILQESFRRHARAKNRWSERERERDRQTDRVNDAVRRHGRGA